MHRLPMTLFALIAAFALSASACEEEKEESANEAKAEAGTTDEASSDPADPKSVDFDADAKLLTTTSLNPFGSRNMALADVAGRVLGIPKEKGETEVKYLARACAKVRPDCATTVTPDLQYLVVLSATVNGLKAAATAQGKPEAASALGQWASMTTAMAGGGWPVQVPAGTEPLNDLVGDPLLVVKARGESADLDIMVGPTVARSIEGIWAEEQTELDALFDNLETGDLFAATGMNAPPDAKVELQSGTPLRIVIPADQPAGPTVEFLRVAYKKKKIQKVELVWRSKEYNSLAALPINLVNTKYEGGKFGVKIASDQVTWWEEGETKGEDDDVLKTVGWDDIGRLGEIAKQPLGQPLVYVEITPEVTGQQVADAIGALRLRCGDQAMCATMQLTIALKPADPD